jgi:AbiV family abortive infection protein
MMPAHLSSIRDNAFRLYEDAGLLMSNKRYASAIALSILAIEEVGKYLILRDDKNDSKAKRLRHHSVKQSALSGRYLSDLWMSLLRRLLVENRELMLKRLAELRSLGPPQELSDDLPASQTSDQIREIFEEVVRQQSAENLLARYVLRTGLGDTSKIKNRAFYVDDSDDDCFNPADFTRSDAEEWLRQADRALAEIAYDQ